LMIAIPALGGRSILHPRHLQAHSFFCRVSNVTLGGLERSLPGRVHGTYVIKRFWELVKESRQPERFRFEIQMISEPQTSLTGML